MYSLLYPAVLGTVLLNVFVFLSKVVEGESISGSDFGIGKLVLTFGIVVHFIVDYILGQEAPEHGWRGFWLDCGILGGLWVAAASVHINLSTAPDVQILCGALAWVYLLFLAYLLFVYRGLQHRKLVGVVESIGLVMVCAWRPMAFVYDFCRDRPICVGRAAVLGRQ